MSGPAARARVFAICSDFDRPLGGNKKLYRHVDILNNHGFDAWVLHEKVGFRCTWFRNSTRVAYVPDLPGLGPPDFLLLTEAHASPGWPIPRGVAKVILNQNCYYTFNSFSLDPKDLRTAYHDPEVVATLVVSDDSRAYLEYVFPHQRIHRIHNAVDEDLFTFSAHKRPLISFMPRKHSEELLQVISLLKFRGVLRNFELAPIEHKTEEEVAAILRDSLFFLNSGYPEGFSLAGAEAMACGCIVIGYHGGGGREYFRDEFCYPIRQGDVLAFAQRVEEAIGLHQANPGALAEKARKAADYVRTNYSSERETRDIVGFWSSLRAEADGDSTR